MMPRRENRKAPRRIKRRGKILYSLIALMLLAGLVPLVLTTAWIMSSSRDALESSERLLQLDQTRSIARQSRLYLQSMHNQIATIAETFEIASDPRAVSQRIASVTSESLRDFVRDYRVLSISVFDADLNFVSAVFPGVSLDDATIESSIRQSLVEALQGRTWVSRPHILEPLPDTVVIISSPVRASSSGEGEPPVVGVVSATISLKPIHEIVKEKGNDRRSVYVVDMAGELVTHWDPETLFEGVVDVSNTAIVQAFQESRGLASGSVNFELSRDGEFRPMLGTYTPIGDRNSTIQFLRELGWGAIVQTEEEAVFSNVDVIMFRSIVTAVLAAVLGGMLVLVFAGRLSRPIAELAEGARRLASGDFSQNIEVASGNEIGEFAETFNFMILEIRRFIERLRRAAEENKQMFLGAVSSLAAAIDAKDPYTAGHSERVAHYSATIAQILGLPEDETEVIRVSALMHDVGKIGIQDSILGKAGPLTDEEYEIMKTHPSVGAAIMEHVPQLEHMMPGIRCHHENVDGSGYPDGLKGDEIPLQAKIVSVADTFDAMATNRPYQKAMEITYVFARMRSFIGKKFEEHIVEALITAYEQGLVRPDMKVVSVIKVSPAQIVPKPAPAPASMELPAPSFSAMPPATDSSRVT